MLHYWILKRPDGTPAGLVRADDDRILFTLNAPIEGRFTLFSESDAVPVTPGSETRLLHPLALLGMLDDRMTCFAAAPDAGSIDRYLDRMSHICTIKEDLPSDPVNLSQNSTIEVEKPPESSADVAESDDNMSQNNTTEELPADSISDTAHDTAEFALLLAQADAFFARFEAPPLADIVQKEDISSQGGIDLFPQQFPGARWKYVDGADVLPHYEGTWRSKSGDTCRILAVRGRAAPRPPRVLAGFTRYLRDRDGYGYWVKITCETDGR